MSRYVMAVWCHEGSLLICGNLLLYQRLRASLGFMHEDSSNAQTHMLSSYMPFAWPISNSMIPSSVNALAGQDHGTVQHGSSSPWPTRVA